MIAGHRRASRMLGALTCWVALITGEPQARAEPPTPVISARTAVEQIAWFDSALMSALRAPDKRDRLMSEAVDQSFNVSVMTRFVLGDRWEGINSEDRSAIQLALRDYTIARFTHAFGQFAGQTFVVDPVARVRGPDMLVKTVVQLPNEEPDHVDYRMRQYDGAWKVIDVYYDGVSDLTTQKADLAATVATGGATALVAKIREAIRKLR